MDRQRKHKVVRAGCEKVGCAVARGESRYCRSSAMCAYAASVGSALP